MRYRRIAGHSGAYCDILPRHEQLRFILSEKPRRVIASVLIIGAMLVTSIAMEAQIHPRAPRRWRSLAGSAVCALMLLLSLGLFLAISGHLMVSAAIVTALMMAIALASNAKHAVLGEPLLFSDLALAGEIVRHPQFYFSALRPSQLVLLATGAVALPALLAWMFVPGAAAHLAGLLVAMVVLTLLVLLPRLPPWQSLPLVPDMQTDVQRHGLMATILLHAAKWRQTPDPSACLDPIVVTSDAELVVIVQCESFADPVELFGSPRLALPGLTAARANALHYGNLQVSGFGAYTMRTEYGVLFGRSEAALGFRRFDPFLTAAGEVSHALPARLRPAGWRSVFVHPHDMAFYGRDRILPEAGFDELLGEDTFLPPAAGEGRYITDAALATRIIELARQARGPTLIYAVTIENHGPWPSAQDDGGKRQSSGYLRLVRKGDEMLSSLMSALGHLGRPALLVFFGDHRPSIPGLSDPGGDRHTPYVVLRFGAEGLLGRRDGLPHDLSPADLHQVLLGELTDQRAVVGQIGPMQRPSR